YPIASYKLCLSFLFITPRPPSSTLFPYTTLFRSWLYRIATNECITFLNKKKQKQNVSLDDESSSYLSETLADGAYFNGDKAQMKLQQALLTLPEKQRLVFNMKYFEDLKYEEISDILGTSVGALKASYHLAVKKIEQFFNSND